MSYIMLLKKDTCFTFLVICYIYKKTYSLGIGNIRRLICFDYLAEGICSSTMKVPEIYLGCDMKFFNSYVFTGNFNIFIDDKKINIGSLYYHIDHSNPLHSTTNCDNTGIIIKNCNCIVCDVIKQGDHHSQGCFNSLKTKNILKCYRKVVCGIQTVVNMVKFFKNNSELIQSNSNYDFLDVPITADNILNVTNKQEIVYRKVNLLKNGIIEFDNLILTFTTN